MKSWIITIGSEIITGRTLNTNASYICRCLAQLGIECERQVAIADDAEKARALISEALERAELVVITGGLGPTEDDLTLEAISRASEKDLICVEGIKKELKKRYKGYGARLTSLALRQSLVPFGAEVLKNPHGTAPGLWLQLERNAILALPGVPGEMRAIMEQSALDRLRRISGSPSVMSRTIRTVGLVELKVQDVIKRIGLPKSFKVGLYPNLGMVDVQLTPYGLVASKAKKLLDIFEKRLRKELGESVYANGTEQIEETVGALFAKKGLSIAIAESCTGGLISDKITNVPGSSRYFLMSVVAYNDRIKKEILGVSGKVLSKSGAVSHSAAIAMARGIRKISKSDIGLSVTGIAGPGGTTAQKRLGLVYIAVSDKDGDDVKRFCFKGDRLAVKNRACLMALNVLRLRLLGKGPVRKSGVCRSRTGKSALE